MSGPERCRSAWRAGFVGALALLAACQTPAPSPPPATPAPVAPQGASLDTDPRRALRDLDARLARDPGDAAAQQRKLELLFELELEGRLEPARRQEARTELDALLASRPDDPPVLALQAQRLAADRKPEEALATIRRSLELASDPSAKAVEASVLEQLGDIAGARRTLEDALLAAPDAHRLRLQLSRLCILAGDHRCALDEARRVAAARPADEAPRLAAADALVRSGRPEAGLAELQVIPAPRRSGELLYRMGEIQRMQGDALGARRTLTEANRRRPNDPDVLGALFELDARSGGLVASQSLEAIAHANAKSPDDARLAELLGRAHAATGRVDEALASFERALELEPRMERVYGSVLAMFASMKEEQALRLIEEARKTRPGSGVPDLVLGGLYDAKGDHKRALAAYEKALALDPGNPIVRNSLAYLLLASGGDAKRAQRLAQEARRELPRSPLVADTLGYALLRNGDPGAAQPLFFEAIGRFSASSVNALEVNVHLAEAERALGQNDKARARLQRVVARVGPGGPPPGGSEPAWVGRARSLLAELEGR